jgi:drug/metabolite transporter (DMT)-like permease
MQLLRSFLMFGMPIFFITALYHMSSTNALTIFWVAPLVALGLSSVLLAERISLFYWLTSLASFVGVLLILRPDGDIWHWSVILPLGMAFCFSLYQVMTRMMHDEDTLASLFYTALGVFVILSFGLPFFWQPLTLSSGLLMTAIGLLGFLGLFTLDKSLELAPVSAVAPFAYTQPIWFSGLSYILTGHFPGRAAILGMVIIISSGIYLIIKD